jgi:GT2 family glycosyltransferase
VCHSCGYERIISEREFTEDLQQCPNCASETVEVIDIGDIGTYRFPHHLNTSGSWEDELDGRLRVIDIELSRPIRKIDGLTGYTKLCGLVRLFDRPIGYVIIPVEDASCSGAAIRNTVLKQLSSDLLNAYLELALMTPAGPDRLKIENVLRILPYVVDEKLPLVTIAVCTHDRTSDLKLCLESLKHLDYPNLDVLVVDNAPSTNSTSELLAVSYPQFRYVREPRHGLDWARNLAVTEALGEIIAFADDDTVVDPGWVRALVNVFHDAPDVMCVTGLVVPFELETDAQRLFEEYVGFGRGFKRCWHHSDGSRSIARHHIGTGNVGTGANMAFRRSVFDSIGKFDPALDVGTVTRGGGDLEMFFRVLKEGHTLVYEPRAVVRHRHRREYPDLRLQIEGFGIGYQSYLMRTTTTYPEESLAVLCFGTIWHLVSLLQRFFETFMHSTRIPRDLIRAHLTGSFVGLRRYQVAHSEIISNFDVAVHPGQPVMKTARKSPANASTLRIVNLDQPVQTIDDAEDYRKVFVYAMQNGHLVGRAQIHNFGRPINAQRLCDNLISQIGLQLFYFKQGTQHYRRNTLIKALMQHYVSPKYTEERSLSDKTTVSVVLATLDRPTYLRRCLIDLAKQRTHRMMEILVVDNNPISGVTPEVVREFSNVRLIEEQRRGLSYARNAGITASKGDIIVSVDDDTRIPEDWLEKLLAPFAQNNVMIVTGNVLPFKQTTRAERAFEEYGGLGRGFKRRVFDRHWFDSFRTQPVPTWEIGATANAAFRSSIFTDPEIGMLREELGPGTPAGCGEDIYLFYKTLKKGHTIVYEPSAFVWHKHRSTIPELRHQLYAYSKGHIAYHLMTLREDRDLRAIGQLLWRLPTWHLYFVIKRLFSHNTYPLSLKLTEIAGNLVGFWILKRSRQRVGRLGPSKKKEKQKEFEVSKS